MKKKLMAMGLVVVLAISGTQMAGATTLSKAKNQKNQAQSNLNSVNSQIDSIKSQQSALQSQIDQVDSELVQVFFPGCTGRCTELCRCIEQSREFLKSI